MAIEAGADRWNGDVVTIITVVPDPSMEIVTWNTIGAGPGRQIGNHIIGHQRPRRNVGRAVLVLCTIRISGRDARPAAHLVRERVIPPRSGRTPYIRITTLMTDIGGKSCVGAGRKIRSFRPPIIVIQNRSVPIGVGVLREMVMIICADKNQKGAIP